MNTEADKTESELVLRLLTLLQTFRIDNACFVKKEAFGSAIYVQDASCKVYNLDAFSQRRLPSDRVLAIEYPEWLEDFAMHTQWFLTPKNITCMITLKNHQFMFVFSINSGFDEVEFNAMLEFDKSWNALMVKDVKELPLAISKRRIRGLKVGSSRSQLFKIQRF